MTTFPDWTGPEAVRRLNIKIYPGNTPYAWPNSRHEPAVLAMQQLMVDLNMPEPKDAAEELIDAINAEIGGVIGVSRVDILPLIRAALAKAAGA